MPIDLNALSDGDAHNLLGGAPTAPVNPTAPAAQPAPQAPLGPQSIDINALSDEDTHALAAPPAMGPWEAAARLYGHQASFGLADPWIGKDSIAQAQTEHPYIDYAMMVPAAITQGVALGPVGAAAGRLGAAAEVAGPIARTIGKPLASAVEKGVGLFQPNLGAKTVGQAALTGSKVGASYSGATALGTDVTDPNKSWTDTAGDVASATGAGAATGFAMGAGAHGASRLLGAAANRIVPGWRQAFLEARAPGAQGARELERQAGYDKADIGKLVDQITPKPPMGSAMTREQAAHVSDRLMAGEAPDSISATTGFPRSEIDDIAAQHSDIENKYGGLNLLEMLKMGELEQNGRGEWQPKVVTTRNLDKTAQRYANIEGEGSNEAANAFAARKQQLSEATRNDVDRAFGSDQASRDAADVALQKQKGILDKGYSAIRNKGPVVNVQSFGNYTEVPAFQKALQYAAVTDAVRKGNGEMPGLHKWTRPDGTTATEGQQDLTPSNLLDIHHALVMQARSANAPGADPVEAATAGQLKSWFSGFVDNVFKKHQDLRTDYKAYKDVMEAQDRAQELGLNTTNRKAMDSMDWFTNQQNRFGKDIGDLQDEIARQQKFLDDTRARHNANAATSGNPINAAQKSAITRAQTRLDSAQNRLDLRQMQFQEFGRSWGESIVSQIEGATDPNASIRKLLTMQGQRRITTILGPEQGKQFIQALENKSMQTKLGNTLYGGSDTAFKLKGFEPGDAWGRMVMAFNPLHPRPLEALGAGKDLLSIAHRQRTADQVNKAFAKQGVQDVRPLANSLLKQQQVRSTLHPYVRNPTLGGIGDAGEVEREQTQGLVGRQTRGAYPPGDPRLTEGHARGGAVMKRKGLGRPHRASGGGILEDALANPHGWGESPSPYDPDQPELRGTGMGESRDPEATRPNDPLHEAYEQAAPMLLGEGLGKVAQGAGLGLKALGRGMSEAPVSSAIGMGGLGLTATASGAGDKAPPGAPSNEVMGPELQEQIDQLNARQKQLYDLQAKARGDMEGEEKGTKGGGAGKGKHYDTAQSTFADIGAEIARNEMKIADLQRRTTPEYKTERGKVNEAEQARQGILDTSRKGFEQDYPTAAKYWWTVPAALAATSVFGKGLGSTIADYGSKGRWWAAVNAANDTTLAPEARAQASILAREYAKDWPKPGIGSKIGSVAGPVGIGALEGGLAANAPQFYNFNLPQENPDHRAFEEYKKRLPAGVPEAAHADEMLDKTPWRNPTQKAAQDYFTDWSRDKPAPVLGATIEGAFEGAGGALAAKSALGPAGPFERQLPRAATRALPEPTPPPLSGGSLGKAPAIEGQPPTLGLGMAAPTALPKPEIAPSAAEAPSAPTAPVGTKGSSASPTESMAPPELPSAAKSAEPVAPESNASDYTPAKRTRARNGHIMTEWGWRHKPTGRWGNPSQSKAKIDQPEPGPVPELPGLADDPSSGLSGGDADAILSGASRNPKVRAALDAGDVQGAASLLGQDAGVSGHQLIPHVERWIKAGKFD